MFELKPMEAVIKLSERAYLFEVMAASHVYIHAVGVFVHAHVYSMIPG